MVDVGTPCTDACVTLASVACGRPFADENTMISALGLDQLTTAELLTLARDGYRHEADA
jgi:hypothetical protein